jgi:alpha-amylase
LKGLPSLFNFDLGYSITSVASAGMDTIDIVQKYKNIADYYKSITPNYIDATFVKNHDQTRILTELKGNVDKAKMTAAILLTMPGTPYLYYGEEIGMLGDKLSTYADQFGPDAFVREPFVWNEGRNDVMQTAWEVPQYSTDKTVVPLSKQQNDPKSLFNFYKPFIQYRNTSRALTYGDINHSGLGKGEILSFTRKHEDDEVLVLHNLSDVEVTVTLVEQLQKFKTPDFSSDGSKVNVEEGVLKVPAYTTIILK